MCRPMNSPSSATASIIHSVHCKNRAGKDTWARLAATEAKRATERPLHFVFSQRMRQLSPLTHRSSIRFCTQSCGRIKRTWRHRCTPWNVSIGIDRRSIDPRRLLLQRRRAAPRETFCNGSCLHSRSADHNDIHRLPGERPTKKPEVYCTNWEGSRRRWWQRSRGIVTWKLEVRGCR